MSMYRRPLPMRPYRGMGQACPSLAQLTGTLDPNDPCQALNAPTDFSNPSAVINPGGLVPGGDTYAGAAPITVAQWQAAVASGNTPPTTPASSLASWISQNQTTILIGLAVVAGLMLVTPRR